MVYANEHQQVNSNFSLFSPRLLFWPDAGVSNIKLRVDWPNNACSMAHVKRVLFTSCGNNTRRASGLSRADVTRVNQPTRIQPDCTTWPEATLIQLFQSRYKRKSGKFSNVKEFSLRLSYAKIFFSSSLSYILIFAFNLFLNVF